MWRFLKARRVVFDAMYKAACLYEKGFRLVIVRCV